MCLAQGPQRSDAGEARELRVKLSYVFNIVPYGI